MMVANGSTRSVVHNGSKSSTALTHFALQANRNRRVRRSGKDVRKQTSISALLTDLVLTNKENFTSSSSLQGSNYSTDMKENPDLWLAAFDNPIDFIQYCRKRIDYQRKLLDSSRKVESEILQFVKKWTQNTAKQGDLVNEIFQEKQMNEKLQEVIMEERTHCQHLVGVNEMLETERQIMSRKYQASLLLGKVKEESVHHLLEKNPKAVPLTDRLTNLGERLKKCNTKSKTSKSRAKVADPIVLAERVERLEKYVDALKTQHRDEVTVLKDTINHYELKVQAMKAEYSTLLQGGAEALKEAKHIIANSVGENLELRQELLIKDDKFLQAQMDEITNALRKRPQKEKVCSKHDICQAFQEANQVENNLKVRLAQTEIELVEKSNVLRDTMSKMLMLDRKCVMLEKELQVTQKTHHSCVTALKNRTEVLEKRCEKTDERRKTDNAGFREDIHELKLLLKNLNKNIQKCVLLYGEEKKKNQHLEAKGAPKPRDEVLEKLLLEAGYTVHGRRDVASDGTSTKPWIQNVDPKIVQQAMTTWADFLGKKLENLEEKVCGTKVEVLYVNKKPMQSSKSKEDIKTAGHLRRGGRMDSDSTSDYQDPPY